LIEITNKLLLLHLVGCLYHERSLQIGNLISSLCQWIFYFELDFTV